MDISSFSKRQLLLCEMHAFLYCQQSPSVIASVLFGHSRVFISAFLYQSTPIVWQGQIWLSIAHEHTQRCRQEQPSGRLAGPLHQRGDHSRGPLHHGDTVEYAAILSDIRCCTLKVIYFESSSEINRVPSN